MSVEILKADEIRGWAPAKLKEAEDGARLKIAEFRMDLYSASGQKSADVKKLKKNIARILTVKSSAAKNVPVAKKTAKAKK
jgi:ribosomal protein L29